MRDELEVDWSVEGDYATDVFTDAAVGMIEAHDDEKPMFLYLAHQAAHVPLQAPQEYIDKFSYIEDEERRKLAG